MRHQDTHSKTVCHPVLKGRCHHWDICLCTWAVTHFCSLSPQPYPWLKGEVINLAFIITESGAVPGKEGCGSQDITGAMCRPNHVHRAGPLSKLPADIPQVPLAREGDFLTSTPLRPLWLLPARGDSCCMVDLLWALQAKIRRRPPAPLLRCVSLSAASGAGGDRLNQKLLSCVSHVNGFSQECIPSV